MIRRPAHRPLVVALGLLALVPAGDAAEPPRFSLTVLPPAQSDVGEFEILEARKLNDRGQVAGDARQIGSGRQGVFRFTPGRGTEILDPGGRNPSRFLRLNEAGQVFGGVEARGVRSPFRSLWIADDRGAFDRLKKGLKGGQRRRLRVDFSEFNDAGEVLTELEVDGFFRPFVYRPDSGWRELTAGEPELADVDVFVDSFNNRGDASLGIVESGPSGQVVREETFLYLRDRTIVPVPRYPGDLNGSAEVAGTDISSSRAFYASPESGVIDMHPAGFRASGAGSIREDGTFLLAALRNGARGDRPYWFFAHVDRGLTPVLEPGDARRLARRSGCRNPRQARIAPWHVNERLEVAGSIICNGGRGRFLYRPESGFELLQDLVDDLGMPELEVRELIDLNEAGQILLQADSGTATAAAILTPLE